MDTVGRFGVELEFSLLTAHSEPAFGLGPEAVAIARDVGLAAETELGSFQIELNPGPWPLTDAGFGSGLAELHRQVGVLGQIVSQLGAVLTPCGLTPLLRPEWAERRDFFTHSPRYEASAKFFGSRQATVRFLDGTQLTMPGESVIACLNEMHIHLQLPSDDETLRLFNELNAGGTERATRYLTGHVVNGKALARDCTTMTLFEEANGDSSNCSSLRRVCFLPMTLTDEDEYAKCVRELAPIPLLASSSEFPGSLRTAYFWVRLHRDGSGLRVEYRPIDMSPEWPDTLGRFLSDLRELTCD